MKHFGKMALLLAALTMALATACNKETVNTPGGNYELNDENVMGTWTFDSLSTYAYQRVILATDPYHPRVHVMTFCNRPYGYTWTIDNGTIKGVAVMADSSYARETVNLVVKSFNKYLIPLEDEEGTPTGDTATVLRMNIIGSIAQTELGHFDTVWTFKGNLERTL